jgi:hypothetical protein
MRWGLVSYSTSRKIPYFLSMQLYCVLVLLVDGAAQAHAHPYREEGAALWTDMMWHAAA